MSRDTTHVAVDALIEQRRSYIEKIMQTIEEDQSRFPTPKRNADGTAKHGKAFSIAWVEADPKIEFDDVDTIAPQKLKQAGDKACRPGKFSGRTREGSSGWWPFTGSNTQFQCHEAPSPPAPGMRFTDAEKHLLASAIMDSLVFAGGLSVPSIVSTGWSPPDGP